MKTKNIHAVALGRLGGKAGTGQAKAVFMRQSEEETGTDSLGTVKCLIRTTSVANWLSYYGSNPEYRYYGEREIGDGFESNGQRYIVVTVEQAASFERVVRHQGIDTLKGVHMSGFGNDHVVAVEFEHIWIGIERDGYAHS